MTQRLAGIFVRPRATLEVLVARPSWAGTWLLILAVWALSAGWLLNSAVGPQAVVDERVRVVETLGGTVSDAEYAAWQADPPWWIYLTSGSRLLLTPVVTVAMAVVLWAAARADGATARLSQGLAIVVHASVVLALGQLLAAPLHYFRESLTSPFNLAAVMPVIDEGTMAARFFGTLDLFVLWWLGLLGVGLSVMTRRRMGRYLWSLAAVYLAVAAVAAGVIAVAGGA